MSKRTTFSFSVAHKKKYGFWKFMGDMLLVVLTGGLWLIWMIVRALRNN